MRGSSLPASLLASDHQATLYADASDGSVNQGRGFELRVTGVGQSVRVRRGVTKTILSSIDGSFAPGNLTALMGASGAGKTTLLSVLRSGRSTVGTVTINGRRYSRQTRRLIVTVPQDDVLLAGLTPLEMLSYAAHLVLPRALGRAAKLARVHAVLTELNLCGDDVSTRIGSVDERGLSGGQRKRVSIGLELLANPAVLLCDEPTSGLDAKMAADVVAILRKLSRSGRTVVATIHQPSFALFSAFDELLLLTAGRVAFSGPTRDSAAHFSALGFPTPAHENPADYMMRLLQDSDEARGVNFALAWEASEAARLRQHATSEADAAAAESLLARADLDGASGGGLQPVGYVYQTAVLLNRTLYDAFKDPSKVLKTVVLKTMVGLLSGTIWFGQARSGSYGDIFSITGALFMCVTTATLEVLLDTVLEFPLARALLMRELANNHYSLPAYYSARTLANLVFACVNTTLVAVPVYTMVGLSLQASKFGIFCGCLVLLELIGSCIGILVGCISRDINDARTTLLPTLAPLLIFSGYVVPYSNIPIYFRWAYYASFFQYAFAVLMINELADRTFDNECPAQLAEEAIVAEIEKALFPNATVPPWVNWTFPKVNWTCTGHSYLHHVDMWPVAYGGLQNYFAIIGGYLAISLTATYVVLHWRTHSRLSGGA